MRTFENLSWNMPKKKLKTDIVEQFNKRNKR